MTVKIILFGDFQLQVDGASASLTAQKSKALLAWLACHPDQRQPRDRLAGLLWADRSTANAKTSLRQALAGIRKLLPEGLLAGHGEYLGFESGQVMCDVTEFRAGCESEDRLILGTALALYQGDLLDGFHARSAAFDEWLSQERESLRREALLGLQRLLGLEQAAGDIELAIQTAGRLLRLDPLQEDVHRQLMQLYMQLDQLGSAQRQFNQCRDVLEQELGVPPAPETLALLHGLGSGTELPTSDKTATALDDRRPALPSLAVLPFQNRSSVDEHVYFADGMTEELINLLGQSANWRVCSRSVSFNYRDQEPDARQVGRELNVGYLVEGTVRSMGPRIRIHASLINTADGSQIWSQRYERPVAELFDVQDEVVHAIFRTLKNRLGFAERERVRRTPQMNLDAWGLLIKAMQVHVVNPATHLDQLALVREALAIEPDYPRAQAYLSSLLFTAVGRGTVRDKKAYVAEARPHMEAALANGSADAVVLKMCAGGLAAVGQPQYALRLAEQAFEITRSADPLFVAVLMWNGRIDEALAQARDLVQALPDSLPSPPGELRPIALLGNLHMLRGELDAALEHALRDQRGNPGNFFAHVNLANVYGLQGEADKAADAWELALGIVPTLTVPTFAEGYAQVFADADLGAKFSAGLIAAGFDVGEISP